jgi:hypothetical protein
MTKSQQYGRPAAAVTHWRAPASGELVACAKLWLTRQGDLDDHVLHPGERVRLDRGDDIVVEALRQDPAPLWRWQPAVRPAKGWRAWLARTVGSAGPALRPDSCTQA